MAFTVGVVCHLGIGPEKGGRERNEDSYLICQDGEVRYPESGAETREPHRGDGLLVAVCDGMGGHSDGHVASSTAVKVLAKLYQPGAPRRPAKVLLKYVQDSHRQLHWAAKQNGAVTMGTTLTAAWILNGKVAWTQVGDSRLYLHRAERIFQLTADQTRNEFSRRDGRPIAPDGEHLVQNFIYGSRGLGDNASLRLDQGLDSGMEVLHVGDRLLLCSDGLSGCVGDDAISQVLSRVHGPQEAAETLCRMALEGGGRDNVTAVVVRVDALPNDDVDEWLDDPEETVQF